MSVGGENRQNRECAQTYLLVVYFKCRLILYTSKRTVLSFQRQQMDSAALKDQI